MLRSVKTLEEYAIQATDGPIGQVKDLYFDDARWVIRYLVVDTGTWLSSREVLITPWALNKPNWPDRLLPVSITREQVKNSPDIDTHQPVSRQNEMQVLGYYGYPSYWDGTNLWGDGPSPYAMAVGYDGQRLDRAERNREQEATLAADRLRHRNDDPHLRSCNAVQGYHLHASDGDIGHVAGFLVDEDSWAIRYLIVKTTNWWVGHEVLIAPLWITAVHWPDQSVSVDLTREAIRQAPVYDDTAVLDHAWEARLYAHHGRPLVWPDGGSGSAAETAGSLLAASRFV